MTGLSIPNVYENWKEIRLEDCDDGLQFSRTPACQIWTRQLVSFIIEKVGIAPKIKINAYKHGRYTMVSMDIDPGFSQFGQPAIEMSITLSSSRIYLPAPADTQFDIDLPGIVDAFNLIGTVAFMTQGLPVYPHQKIMY
ncbi:hypothetical protein MTYM_01304 [Methylococcales bacterium]|nr:hypothetical protein MTYM_01304 [Methylococcales bacterium]